MKKMPGSSVHTCYPQCLVLQSIPAIHNGMIIYYNSMKNMPGSSVHTCYPQCLVLQSIPAIHNGMIIYHKFHEENKKKMPGSSVHTCYPQCLVLQSIPAIHNGMIIYYKLHEDYIQPTKQNTVKRSKTYTKLFCFAAFTFMRSFGEYLSLNVSDFVLEKVEENIMTDVAHREDKTETVLTEVSEHTADHLLK